MDQREEREDLDDRDRERGTCPCGHEIDSDGACRVWDAAGVEHVVPPVNGWSGGVCSCHGRAVRDLEEGKWPKVPRRPRARWRSPDPYRSDNS